MRLAGRRRTGLALTELAAIVAVATAAGFAAPASAQATTYPDAVVLVSGFNTNSPFTTPDPACNGREGEVWNPPTGPAGALKARGFAVFTAPVRHLQDPEAPACSATGAALPPQSQYIDSGGDIEANGVALAGFLAFLRDSYGVRRVHLVAHSDGGNWSRSALARSDAFAGVTVASLTTLGTPYNGSFLADLAFEIQGAGCDLPNPIERDLCKALGDVVDLIVADEGEIATRQLTRSFLVSWNRTQQIGSCPVTTIAGTYFDIPFFDLHYYDPADGYVGEASALAHRSYDIAGHPIPAPTIPGLRSGGTFPVVHAASLSFIDPDNLLNQQVISNQVAAIVAGTPPGGPACNAPGASLASASQRTVPPAARAAGRRAIRLRLPLRLLGTPSTRGRLSAPRAEDAVVVGRGVAVRCRRRKLPRTPLLGDTRLQLVLGAHCRRPLRVGGRRRARALLLRSHPRNDVILVVRGRRLRVRVRGPAVIKLRATVAAGARKRPLRIGRKGRAVLPRGGHVAVRVYVTTAPGGRHATAGAVLALP